MWPHGVVTNVILSKGIQPKTYVLCKSFCAISCNVPSQAIFICGVRSWDGVTIAGGGGALGRDDGKETREGASEALLLLYLGACFLGVCTLKTHQPIHLRFIYFFIYCCTLVRLTLKKNKVVIL